MNKINFIYGNDEIQISEKIDDIKLILRKKENLSIENLNFLKLDDVRFFLSNGFNASLFPQNILLIINLNLRTFKSMSDEIKDLVDLLILLNNEKSIVITLHVDKYDKTTKKQILDSELLTALKDFIVSEEYIKLKPWQTVEIKNRVLKIAEKYNLKFTPKALDAFIEIFKNKLELVSCELSKLSVYLMPENLIGEECIKKFYSFSFNVDDLYNHFIGVSKKRFTFNRNDDSNLLYDIAVLQNKLRDSLNIKQLLDSGFDVNSISKQIPMHPYKLQQEIKLVKNMNAIRLKNIISNLSDIEYKLKTGLVKEKDAKDILFLISFSN